MAEVVSGILSEPLDILGRLLAPEGKQNPYPLYEEMRVHGPVVTIAGVHTFITGYAECAQALREPRLLSTDAAVQDQRLQGWHEHSSWRWLTQNMLFSNDPDHDRLRRFFGNAFSARRVAEMRSLVEELAYDAVRHVATLGAGGQVVDLVPEFSFRFPMAVIGRLLGVPEADQLRFREAIGDITSALEPVRDLRELERGDAGMDLLAEYLTTLIARLRETPGPDLTSGWIKALNEDAEITEEELLANLMLLLVAATEAPQDLLSNTVRLALEQPAHAARLRENPEFVESFVKETLRFDPAVQVLNRVAAEDLDFFGARVTAHSPVTLLIAAGNRDPRRFDNPLMFDPARPDNQALTFSAGGHYCLGAALAHMSAEVVLPLLLRSFPDLSLAGDATFRVQVVQRGHEHLPVAIN